ncbi:MAG: signal recognition particle protein, partial [Gaiellales bacterium]
PIKFVALGEQLDALEYFHPDRMASRILGMGDVLTLIEKAEQAFEDDDAAAMEARLKKGQFTFEDFLKQMKMMRRMGSFKGILSMLPGIPKEIRNLDIDEKQIARIEAIVLSMTTEERAKPDIIDGARRRRIAAGSGHDVQAVNQLIKQFDQMRKMMKTMMKGGGKLPPGFDPGAPGGGMQLPGGGAFPGLGRR